MPDSFPDIKDTFEEALDEAFNTVLWAYLFLHASSVLEEYMLYI